MGVHAYLNTDHESLSESKGFGLGIDIFSSITHYFMHHLWWQSIADDSIARKSSFGIGANFSPQFYWLKSKRGGIISLIGKCVKNNLGMTSFHSLISGEVTDLRKEALYSFLQYGEVTTPSHSLGLEKQQFFETNIVFVFFFNDKVQADVIFAFP